MPTKHTTFLTFHLKNKDSSYATSYKTSFNWFKLTPFWALYHVPSIKTLHTLIIEDHFPKKMVSHDPHLTMDPLVVALMLVNLLISVSILQLKHFTKDLKSLNADISATKCSTTLFFGFNDEDSCTSISSITFVMLVSKHRPQKTQYHLHGRAITLKWYGQMNPQRQLPSSVLGQEIFPRSRCHWCQELYL